MKKNLNIFFNKKILVYGLGKSGLSAYNFLKKNNDVLLYDDFQKKQKNLKSYEFILKKKFDYIIISPGIDIYKCKLSKFLKQNLKKIYTDLDVFYSNYKNNCITITGTNGKSTTCRLLYEILCEQKYDVRLVGNIGNPILSTKRIKPKTIFVVEASSYQLEYSQIFKSKYAAILNITPDHIERHKTLKRYIKAKFKLLSNQTKNSLGFIKKNDPLIQKELKVKKLSCKIIKVNTHKINKIFDKLNNEYFTTEANKENLSFVLSILKKFKLKKNLLIKTIKNFKGLKYRQQIIYKKSYLTIINDSKSTSFSSSIGILKSNPNIYWLLGGMYKKGDKFNLPKKYYPKIKAFIFGKNRGQFNNELKGKFKVENFDNLKDALKKVLLLTKREKFIKKTILFSPSAASFDNFKNFEDRGFYFNKLVKRYLNV
ncbi:UDP-N-acetylmuramoyl-L-alanine--D-glutamate ligase [Candidatus Pelagibacter sp.]|nr:UDP-N-acetylmuramoyl-L-alanine--D-glutamate ligase [Candidatus Pelagibacter sp.]